MNQGAEAIGDGAMREKRWRSGGEVFDFHCSVVGEGVV